MYKFYLDSIHKGEMAYSARHKFCSGFSNGLMLEIYSTVNKKIKHGKKDERKTKKKKRNERNYDWDT